MQLDTDKIGELLAEKEVPNPVSEVHGIVTGQVCAGSMAVSPEVTWQLLGLEGAGDDTLNELVRRLAATTAEEMEIGEFTFQPLLPDEEEDIGVRLRALGRWCEGFNTGFGAGFGKSDGAIPEDTREVLKDFAAIAEVEEAPGGDDEQNEANYMEVVEYVRMAASTVYLQNNRVGDDDESAPDVNIDRKRLH